MIAPQIHTTDEDYSHLVGYFTVGANKRPTWDVDKIAFDLATDLTVTDTDQCTFTTRMLLALTSVGSPVLTTTTAAVFVKHPLLTDRVRGQFVRQSTWFTAGNPEFSYMHNTGAECLRLLAATPNLSVSVVTGMVASDLYGYSFPVLVREQDMDRSSLSRIVSLCLGEAGFTKITSSKARETMRAIIGSPRVSAEIKSRVITGLTAA